MDDLWKNRTDSKMYIKNYANAQQRGIAAHARQIDDNRGRTVLTKGERDHVNKTIHDPNLEHRPELDPKLKKIEAKTQGMN